MAFSYLTKTFKLIDRLSLPRTGEIWLTQVTVTTEVIPLWDIGNGSVSQWDLKPAAVYQPGGVVKQGCVLAPTLFGIYLPFVLQAALETWCMSQQNT